MASQIVNLAIVLTFLSSPCLAEPLPKDAVPIGASSLTSFYAGSSSNWTNSKAYFAPDGSVKGVYTADDGKKFPYAGKWDVKRNEVCMRVSGVGKTKVTTDCWKWYLGADNAYWTLWTVHFDNTKPTKNDYYKSEATKISRGDTVSAEFAKLTK